MLFNSLPFLLLFLQLSLTGYHLLGALRPRLAAMWLCLASLVFYGWWNPAFVTLLAIVWCAPNSHQIMNRHSPALEAPDDSAPVWLQWRPTAAWTVALLLGYACLHLQKTARFLYFQF